MMAGAMRTLALLLVGLFAVLPAFARDYLELRLSANAYERADRRSAVVAHLKATPGDGLQLLKLVAAAQTNGYYQVEIPGTQADTGWVYKSYVRGYRGPAPAVPSAAPEAAAGRDALSAAAFGACQGLFVNGKPPRAPEATTPLCEEDAGVVFFASGYSKRDNRGHWSAYRIDQEHAEALEDPLPRPKMQFRQNPQLKGGGYMQPRHDSYTETGWDRGHLAPNGAMAWDEQAQRRSFVVSNIAPQKPEMNRNLWRCFEHSIREWATDTARLGGSTYVVVGVVRGDGEISSNRDPNKVPVNVPSHYFAMVYRTKPAPMALGAMVPNEEGHLDARRSMMSVSDLEARTGFRFNIDQQVANQPPNPRLWPARVVKVETLGRLPDIDVQCPRARVSPR